MAQKGGDQKRPTLPTKENQLFKNIVKFYENKQYKKALKAADAILKKFPDHGETLAMKGLTLNSLEKKQEAYDYVRRGLKNDLRSHICWHVYGLLYRSDREYQEAVKCYQNALRNDKENIQILRDLANLQIHLRDVEGFMETRRRLLTLKPTQKQYWIAFAMGAHLSGSHKQAIQILDEFEKTSEVPDKPDFEYSEQLLYKNMIFEESGDLQGGLQHLDAIEKNVVDKQLWKEKRAKYLAGMGRKEEAIKSYKELLSINPDNHNYHKDLILVLLELRDTAGLHNLTMEQVDSLLSFYSTLEQEFPKNDTVIRLPLNYMPANHPKFISRLESYVKPKLRKGVPSLFMDLKNLYKDPSKVQVIDQLFVSYLQSLETSKTFPSTSTDNNNNTTTTTDNNNNTNNKKESPAVLLWTLFYLAHHYDALGQSEKAMQSVDRAIQHTPTVVELYMLRGKIYRHAGSILQASDQFERARLMDLADRWLNTKSSLYFLRSNQIERAVSTLGLFTKEGEEPAANLIDMQCMWFELECGDAYRRTNQMGPALKKYTAVEKHFADIAEDQFDFHTYCLRKMTLRSYISLLRFEDTLQGYQFFVRAAKAIIESYIHLIDHPPVNRQDEEDAELAKLDPEERKKVLRKKKREEVRKLEQERKAKEEQDSKSGKDQKQKQQESNKPVDPDPNGDSLVAVEDKLGAANKYLKILLKQAPNDLQVQLLAFDVSIRRNKYLLALRAVKKAIAIQPDHPDVHRIKLTFFHIVSQTNPENNNSSLSNESVKQVIAQEKRDILGGENPNLLAINQEFFDKHKTSLSHRVAAARVLYTLDKSQKEKALALVMANFDQVSNLKGFRGLQDSISAHTSLLEVFESKESAEEFRIKCRKLFPLATHFMDENERNQVEQQRKAANIPLQGQQDTEDNTTTTTTATNK